MDVSSLCRSFFSLFFDYERKKKSRGEEERRSKEGNCIKTMARLRFKKAMVSKSSKVREERKRKARVRSLPKQGGTKVTGCHHQAFAGGDSAENDTLWA